jgi:hypothetical protein
MKLKAAEFIR